MRQEARNLLPFSIDYRKVAVVVIIVLAIVFRGPIFAALLPFLLALVLANLLEPAVRWLQHRVRLPRIAATIVVLGVLVAVVGYGTLAISTNLYRELLELAALIPTHQKTATTIATDVLARIQEWFQDMPAEVTHILQEKFNDLSEQALDVVGTITNKLLGAAAALPGIIVVLTVTLLATYFFSKDKDIVDATLLQAAPIRVRPAVAEARDKILADLVGFFRAQFVLFVINTGIAATAMHWIGSRYWMIVSLTLGILDLIPVVGPGLILVPWAIVALLLGNVKLALQLTGLLAVMFAVRQLLQIKILGDSIGIHPMLMLFALWAGVVIIGVWGFIVSPVLLIIGKAMLNADIVSRLRQTRETTPAPEENDTL